MRRSLVLPVGLVVGLVVVVLAVALRAAWSTPPRPMSVPAASPAPEPAVDDDPCGTAAEPEPEGPTEIVEVEVDHDPSAIHVRVLLDDLPSTGDHGLSISLQTATGGGTAEVMRLTGDEELTEMFFDLPFGETPDAEDLEDLSDLSDLSGVEGLDGLDGTDGAGSEGCQLVGIPSIGQPCDLDVDEDRDTIEVAVPRSCLQDPAWVRVGVTAWSSQPDDPESYRTASWRPPGSSDPTGFGPPYGPRVPLT